MNALKLIKQRRSVRRYKKRRVPATVVKHILEAGRWAPSGLNNQPWRFLVLEGKEKDTLAKYTHYAPIIKSADKTICVFLDMQASYNYEKDLLSVGACIQNMLLFMHSVGLGACWLGEILNKRKGISKTFGIPPFLHLEAVIAVGYPSSGTRRGKRKGLSKLQIILENDQGKRRQKGK